MQPVKIARIGVIALVNIHRHVLNLYDGRLVHQAYNQSGQSLIDITAHRIIYTWRLLTTDQALTTADSMGYDNLNTTMKQQIQ